MLQSINMKNISAKSLLTVMLVIVFIVLLLRISIAQIISVSIGQNESNASVTLKLVSTALESYAKNNTGSFPPNLAVLTENSPPYLSKEYITRPVSKGYIFNCSRLDPMGYSCSAVPAKCNLTGKKVYSISTGGVLVYESCNKKE